MTERVESELSSHELPGRAEEERAEEASLDRRRSHLAFVAHEIRNPLSTALWSAELLVRMAPSERGAARGEKLSGMCLRSLSRVRLLVEDHFLSERLDVNGIPLRPEPIPVADALQVAIGRRPADAAPCTVEVAPGLVCWADPTMLGRALDSLLFAAGRGGSPVRVEAERAGKLASLRVSGAAPAENALADPDRDAPSDTTGRGLALPAARRIAHALGGALTADPAGYRLTLPLEEAGEDGGSETRRRG